TSFLINAFFPHSSFHWNTGSANSFIEATQAGVYAVTVSNICGTANDSIEVIVDDSLYIELGADTAICLEMNFMLQASQSANQYQWSTGENSQSIAILQTGTYWLQADNACNSSSDTIQVVVNENTFAFAQDTLSLDSSLVLQLEATAGYQSYRWSTSDTTLSIYVTSPGNYWLIVTDTLGCTASDTIVVLPYISSPEQAISTIRLYPNPTSGELFLEGLSGQVRMEVYDFLGKKLISLSSTENKQVINLKPYPKGIYYLIIQTSSQQRESWKVVRL
ncbi:MAG: T9SS type A sorting domain-containing protein, partial [Bacteroidales bacterium]|nr:T9SS type A sorting domain-containing protein [Bacteroidales bacterium]